MAVAKLTKAWTITPNLRVTYVSLVATMGWFAYQNLTALLAAGWTMKFSSDGTTGPSGAGDTTNRITSAAAFATRATIAAAVQSWFVVQNADGLQLLVTFQGATDDICRISYSEGGFTLAGTTTHQPTAASDEMVVSTGNSVINATTSADRVMSIWATTKAWGNALYRSNVLQQYIGVEDFDSAIPVTIQAKPYICFRITDITAVSGNAGCVCGPTSGTAFASAGWTGLATRHTFGGSHRASRINAPIAWPNVAGSAPTLATVALSNAPAMQNGGAMPLFPPMLVGERTANFDGFAGCPYDWWIGYGTNLSTVPGAGDMFPGLDNTDALGDPSRTNWMVALGVPLVRPWRNAAASLLTA